jgi:16S rRNA (guanine527-N7)-methyltransferase
MKNLEIIFKYFDNLNEEKRNKLLKMWQIYNDINEKVNLISKKDISNLYSHHVLHSLSIAKVVEFNDCDKIIDVGTGGGFPGIPLAIFFDKTKFILLDSKQKKINAIKDILNLLCIKNVDTICSRSEDVTNKKYNFVLGRAVTNIDLFIKNTKHLLAKNGKIIYLNGINDIPKCNFKKIELKNILSEEYFVEKQILFIEYKDI